VKSQSSDAVSPRRRGGALLMILLVFCSGAALVVSGLSGNAILPPGQEAGLPECDSTRVAQEIRDAYGEQVWALYRLTPFDSWRAALFFDLRQARQVSASPVTRTCLAEYITLRESGTLRYRIGWLDADRQDGRIAVDILSGSSPALVERLRRASPGHHKATPASHAPSVPSA
jgi:hypothetical protein